MEEQIKKKGQDFPSGSVVKITPVNEGDTRVWCLVWKRSLLQGN